MAQPFHGSMQTKRSASCCHSTPLPKQLSSKATVTLWPLPESVKTMGLCTPVSRRMESALPGLRVRVICAGAAGCGSLASCEQVAARMSKRTLSRSLAAKYGWKPTLNGMSASPWLATVSASAAVLPARV